MRPMMRRALAVVAAVLFVGAAGCEFGNSGRKLQEAETSADLRSVRDEVDRLGVEVEALAREVARSDKSLRDEIAALRQSVNSLEAKSDRGVAEAKKELAAKINEIERKRVSDKNALNEKMNAIVAEMRRALSGGSASGGTSGGTRSERGIYHTVKEGETVSAIAAKYRDKYGATVKAILDANNLTATTLIRPGDKLFIPLKE